MKKKTVFVVGILVCLCLCACSARDAVSESSGSLSSPSQSEGLSDQFEVSDNESEDGTANSASTPENTIDLEIPLQPAEPDEQGNLIIDRENSGTAGVNWMPVNGYTMVDAAHTTDQFSPGIQNADGELILDYISIIRTDGTDIIDYEAGISPRLDLFSQAVNSGSRKVFVSALPNGGGGWDNKNAVEEDPSTYFGYLLDCTIKLTENDFLRFHYYFQAEQRYSAYDELPDAVTNELFTLMDSFSFAERTGQSHDSALTSTSLLETANTVYLPAFGRLINCGDWHDAEEIPVSMYYDWYRDHINSTTTHEERIERYKLVSDPDSPGWAYPAEEFESYIQQHFAVSTEYLRGNDEVYLAEQDVYWLAGGGNNISYRTKVESEEDIQADGEILTIRTACSLLGDFSDTIYKTLVVDTSGEHAEFLSCVDETDGSDIPPQKMVELAQQYVTPIYMCTIWDNTFSTPGEITCWMEILESIVRMECAEGESFWTVYPEGKLSVDEMMRQLNKYFEIDKETVLPKIRSFMLDEDTVQYEGGLGGAYPQALVYELRDNGDTSTVLCRHRDVITGNVDMENDYLITVKNMPDGSFRYISMEKYVD